MAANFKISLHRNGDSLDVKLTGDFDGTSACELLNALEETCDGAGSIFIHTSDLNDIHPFGQDTFHNNLYVLKNRFTRLIFTGQNAADIAPEPNRLFRILIRP